MSSLAINRVVGGVPSYLQGALNANGRVFILNSAGVTFAGTSRVNVGALLATTAMTIDGDANSFANFSAPSGSGGSVVNQGSITVSNGGFAILAAPYVQNTGFIKADLGTVALAGTNSFTLDLRGDGLINFVVPPGTAAEIAADGQKVGVDNSGTLQARSGQVIISANVATQVVNAVVNMSGVVDADALAANGSGGSVLVTSAGDINLGGTITAQGNGTGAGGQIVTKAAGVDNVEAAANLLAQGGSAGGKGGFIEVSGHNVVLDGNIRAGKGGTFFIDPATISIGLATEESFTDKLQVGSAVIVTATDDVKFLATGATHTLLGGSGAFTVKAGDSITFAAGNYIVRTGAGKVSMSAAIGNIGDAGHRLSVVSGVGADHAGTFSAVTQAGDVILAAGKGIFLQDVTIKSAPGDIPGPDTPSDDNKHAKFSADAGSLISIAGAVDVEAVATGDVVAKATVDLSAPHIVVGGDITVLARANGSYGGTVRASALLSANGTVAGSMDFDGAVTVTANAHGSHVGTGTDEAHGNVIANALVRASGADTIDFAGAVNVSAHANGSHVGTFQSVPSYAASLHIGNVIGLVSADAHIHLSNADAVTFNDVVTVTAEANGDHVGSVFANGNDDHIASGSYVIRGSVIANAGIEVNDIHSLTFSGDVTVTANASGHDVGVVTANGSYANVAVASDHSTASVGGNVRAGANVFASYVGGLTFKQDVTVAAGASGSHVGDVSANGNHAHIASAFANNGHEATGEVEGTVFGVASIDVTHGNTVTFSGNVAVTAEGHGNSVGAVFANGSYVQVGIAHDRNASNGGGAFGEVSGRVGASALIDASHTSYVRFGRTVAVTAQANGSQLGVVEANNEFAHVASALGSNHGLNGSSAIAEVEGRVTAHGSVNAGNVGDLTFSGDVTVAANASGAHVGSVKANGSSAHVAVAFGKCGFASGEVEGSVFADANVHLHSAGTVTFVNDVTVTAHGNGFDVAVVTADGKGAHVATAHTSGGGFATAEVEGGVFVNAGVVASYVESKTFEGNLAVTALANGSHIGSVEANGIDANVAIADGSYANVFVEVSGKVEASASVNDHGANAVTFSGDVTVTAAANGSEVGFVEASGNFAHVADAPGDIEGTVSADAHVTASHIVGSYGGVRFLNNVTVTADASGIHVASVVADGSQAHVAIGGGGVRGHVHANAFVHVHDIGSYGSGSVTFDGNVTVTAAANGSQVGVVAANGNHAHVATSGGSVFGSIDANAFVNASYVGVHGEGGVTFNEDVTVTAQANGAQIGGVDADGNLAHVAVDDGRVQGNVIASGFVHVHDVGSYGAGGVTFNGDVTVTAQANGSHVGIVTAEGESAHIATDNGQVNGLVSASAYVDVFDVGTHGSGGVTFNGNVAVTAQADGTRIGTVFASGNFAHVAVNHGEVRGSISASAYVDVFNVGNHGSGGVTFNRDVTVTAQANGSYVGVVTADGEAAHVATGFGNVQGLVSASAYVDVSDVGSYGEGGVTFNGDVTVKAQADGAHIGTVEANGNFAHVAVNHGVVEGSISATSAYVDVSDVGNHGAGGVTFNGDVTVTASANGSHVGVVTADGESAHVATAHGSVKGSISAGAYVDVIDVDLSGSYGAGGVRFNGNVTVTAQADGADVGSVEANGNFAHVAVDGVVDGTIRGSAYVDASHASSYGGGGGVTFNRDVTVTASANGSHVGVVTADGNFAHVATDFGNVQGLVSDSAYVDVSDVSGLVTFNDHVTVTAAANGSDVGTVTADGSYAHVAVFGGHVDGIVRASAYVDVHSVDDLTFKNDVTVTASANGDRVGAVTADGKFAHVATQDGRVSGSISASAYVDAAGIESAAFSGDVTVTANAHGSYVGAVEADGNSAHVADSFGHVNGTVRASAYVDVASIDSATFKHEVTVTAIANGSHVGAVTADGNFARVASYHGVVSGSISASAYVDVHDMSSAAFSGNVSITAVATGKHVGAVEADGSHARVADHSGSINGSVHASAYLKASYMGPVTFADEASVNITALANGTHVGAVTADGNSAHVGTFGGDIGGTVNADAHIQRHSADSITFGEDVFVTAQANGTDVGVVEADGNFAIISGDVSGEVHANAFIAANNVDGNVTFNESVLVTAIANGSHVGDVSTFDGDNDAFVTGNVFANAHVDVDPVLFKVGSLLDVQASVHGSHVGDDVAATAHASISASTASFGGIKIGANAFGNDVAGSVNATALVDVSAEIIVVGPGGIDVEAHAKASYIESYVRAEASAELTSADRLNVFAPTIVKGTASGNHVRGVDGFGQLVAGYDGTEYFGGAIAVRGIANVGSGGADFASANAQVDLDASHNVTVIVAGGPFLAPAITATASADTQHHADHAAANAGIRAEAGVASYESGDPAKRSLGTGSLYIQGGITAQAVAFGNSGGNRATSEVDLEGDNVTVVGNIRSLAHADVVNDFASAEVEIYALASYGHITLIETQDPIAFAIAGSAAVFRQAHFSTEHGTFVGGSYARADIDIKAGPDSSGGVTVIPPNSDQILKLQSLGNKLPGNESSSNLSTIPLSIDHEDCGVLGAAGEPGEDKSKCEKGKEPFHVSETDTLP